ncbi:sugar ABC transporter permease [Treponema sp. J25]|uniref:carbohydrate ABC transporter permease n=1 Tax=Treponema sp. J25 TaxID=2094121 RepID=UPI0010468E98|nr:sugar ABC transporter permease [Treponema sp. J25]TCW62017.1 sugar ABC transporter permease [Treponema sp. J25]
MHNPLPLDGTGEKKVVRTAVLFMGLAHLLWLRDTVKGLLFAAVEIFYIFMIPSIGKKLIDLVTLGSPQPELPIKMRDNSIFMLIDGILTIVALIVFFSLYVISVRSARQGYREYCRKKRPMNMGESFSNILSKAFPVIGLTPSFLLILVLVVVPLIFSASVAFTNYSAPDNIPPNNTVDWVGLANFKTLLGGEASWTSGFVRVATWTVIWAFFATLTCYFGGLFVAILLRESKIRLVPFFRLIFILPYAVPSVVSMLVWRNLLNGTFGTINRTLMALHIIDTPIPWLGDPLLAKIVVILINLWAGFGYFMLLATGAMTAVSQDIFEAARIDGASRFQVLRHITLPLVLYQTMPLIIMSFTYNINNFGAIFFLTGGSPTVADSTITSAGGTDILVTWIYKLTITLLKYNYASVIAVLIFLVLAPFAIFNFRQTKAFKEGDL